MARTAAADLSEPIPPAAGGVGDPLPAIAARLTPERRALAERYVHLARRIARYHAYRHPGMDPGDHVTAAVLGIYNGAALADLDRPESDLEGFLAQHARGAIRHQARDWRNVPAYLQDFWSACRRRMGADWEQTLSDDQAAETMGITVADLQARREATRRRETYSLDAMAQDGDLDKDRSIPAAGGGTLTDAIHMIPDTAIRHMGRDLIRDAIADLPDRMRELIGRIYWNGETLAAAARAMGYPERTAADMRDGAHDRIRRYLARRLQTITEAREFLAD